MAAALSAAALSGCVGTPALTIYGELTDRCFETRTTDEGYFAYIGVTVVNPTARSVILREARALELVNASIAEFSVAPSQTVGVPFGAAPGGQLSPDQRPLWNNRTAVDGTVIAAGDSIELFVELHARNFREYAGVNGLHLKYDDGWFSATSNSSTAVGFVPPWANCSTSRR